MPRAPKNLLGTPPARRRHRPVGLAVLTVLGLFLEACGDGRARPVEVDVGVVQHGKVAECDLLLDLPDDLAARSPVEVELDCSCTTATLGRATADTLLVRLRVDTRELPAADQDSELHHGAVLFAGDDPEPRRLEFRYRFAVASEFELRPASGFDFGAVARGESVVQTILFAVDRDREVQVQAVRCDDSRIHCELDVEPDGVVVRATFSAGRDERLGLFATELEVGTTRDGYSIRVPVRAKVVDGNSPR